MRSLLSLLLLLWCAPAWAATIGQDAFTGTDGTDLDDHTPDAGGGWDIDVQAGPQINSNRCGGDGNSRRAGRITTTVGDDEMDVSGTFNMNNDGADASEYACPAGRIPDGEDGVENSIGIKSVGDGASVDLELISVIASVESSLGTANTDFSDTADIRMKLSLRSSDFKVYADEGTTATTEQISYTASDLLSGNNFGGLSTADNESSLDDFLLESVAAGAYIPQIIKLLDFIESIAHADDGLVTGYYRLPVQTSTVGGITTRKAEGLPSNTLSPSEYAGAVVLYNHGDTMEVKIRASAAVHATMPIGSVRTALTLSSECKEAMNPKGEGRINGR